LTDACWAVSYISDGDNTDIRAVVDSGVVGRLVALLTHMSLRVRKSALRAVGNIMTGDDVLTQVALDCGSLPALRALWELSQDEMPMKKEICWSISNITAGTRAQIQMVMDAGMLEIMVGAAATEQHTVRSEALWAISNALSGGSSEQIAALAQLGCARVLVDAVGGDDARCRACGISGLEGLLKAGNAQLETLGENTYATEIRSLEGVAWLDALEDAAEDAARDKVEFIRKCMLVDVRGPSAAEGPP